jgi:hypothetical protein
MENVTRKIREPFLIARVAEFKTKSSLNEWSICSVHGRTIDIHEEDMTPSYGAPGFTVVFSACCDNALDDFLHFIDEKLGLLSDNHRGDV